MDTSKHCTVGIPIAARILYPRFDIVLSPMVRALAMSLSSVPVVSNVLQLQCGPKLEPQV